MKRMIVIAGCFVAMTIAGSIAAQDTLRDVQGTDSQSAQGTITNGNGATGASGTKGATSKSKAKKAKSVKPAPKPNTNTYVRPTPNGNNGTHVDDVNPQ